MAKFEVVSKYKDSPIDLIPKRATASSAGYDMVAAVDTIIPPYFMQYKELEESGNSQGIKTLVEVASEVKAKDAKPTLISTGVKCALDDNQYLKLVSRSSMPLKHWIICGNGQGTIDADYYNNESNEGEIYFQAINLSPWPILIRAGEKICQGIIATYDMVEGDAASAKRVGGFGSTS